MRKFSERDTEGQSLSLDPGIRRALLESYKEVRVIRGLKIDPLWIYPFLVADRSVLEPTREADRAGQTAAEQNRTAVRQQ